MTGGRHVHPPVMSRRRIFVRTLHSSARRAASTSSVRLRTPFAGQHDARRSVPVAVPRSRPAFDVGQSRCRRQSPHPFPQLCADV